MLENWVRQRSQDPVCQFLQGEIRIDTAQYCFGDQEFLDKIFLENIRDRKGLPPHTHIRNSHNGSNEYKEISERHQEGFGRIPDAFEYQYDPTNLMLPPIVHGCSAHWHIPVLVTSDI